MAYIYKHIRKDTNEIFYIGIGKTKNREYSYRDRNKYWHNIVKKAGFIFETIEDNLSWEDACEKEKKLIKEYGRYDLGLGPLVNMTDGGEGFTSKHSVETKIKMSISKKGYTPWNKGKVGIFTKESKEKMSQSKKGISWGSHTNDTKDKLKKLHIGRKVSLEGIQNMKIAQQSLITPERIEKLKQSHSHQTHKIIQYDMNGVLIKNWNSIGDASKAIGIGKGKISDCCKHKYGCKTAGGFKWEYQT